MPFVVIQCHKELFSKKKPEKEDNKVTVEETAQPTKEPINPNVLNLSGYKYYGESDAEEFAREFNEILDLAIKALEQEPILDKIKEEIKDNTYFINETTEKEGIDFETVEKIIDKYKAKSEKT